MAPLFSSLTISADTTSPKRRKGLLGRPSFFSRPSVASTAASTISTSTTLIPLEPTSSRPDDPSIPPAGLPNSKSINMSTFLSSRPSAPLLSPDTDAAEQLKVSLLPSALSNTSLGPSSAPTGPTPSNSFGGISASTSRNTVLPASHPILTSSGSTFLPPSLSLGFELQETAKALPTLASAIKLPSPARPEGGAGGGGTGVESVITRKPVPGLSAEESAANATAPAPTAIPIAAPAGPTSTLPRSTSGTSIFGSTRLGRMTSRSSIKPSAPDHAQGDRNVSSGAGGMSLGRRISRRLSIDQLRPMFNGGSTKRRTVANPDVGAGGKMDIQRWAQGAVSGAEAGEAPPIAPLPAETAPSDKGSNTTATAVKAKERMVLPGIRTWRSKFSSSKIPPPRPKTTQYSGAGSYTDSIRSQRMDSWVDVGSVRSTMSGMRDGRGLAGALRRMEAEAEGSPRMSVVEASEPAELVPPIAPTIALPSLPATSADSPLDTSSRRSAALLDSLLARPSEEAISTAHPLAEAPTGRATPGFTSSLSTTSLGPPGNLMSPAADDKSLLEPMRSPLPTLPLPIPSRAEDGGMSEAEEIIRDTRESLASQEVEQAITSTQPGLPTSTSRPSLPHPESGLSFHTAQSTTDISAPPPGLPRSRSKSVIDLSTSTSSLIERTEREQGEGWWSAPRPQAAPLAAPMQTRSAFIPSGHRADGSPARPRRSEDRRRSSFLENRRPIVATAVAKLESANLQNSPRRSILRPSKLQFADADEDELETPTRPASRRAFKEIAPSGTPGSKHRRESTTDSFSQLFFGPVLSPSAPRVVDELARLKERHALELDALVSALSAAKAENAELKEYGAQAVAALAKETELRKYAQGKVEVLERKIEIILEYKGEDGEIGFKAGQAGSTSLRTSSALSGACESPSVRRHRRGITRSSEAEMNADEFGRLEG